MNESYVIWGGYGGYNIGDESILWALSTLLRRLSPTVKQYVLIRGSISESVVSQYWKWGVEPVNLFSLRGLRVLVNARLIVGGGQLVDDKTLGWPVGWTSLILLLNSRSSASPLIVCIGAEIIRNPITKVLVRYLYSLAELCSCRDAASAAVLKSAGIAKEKVVTTRDVVFALDRELLPALTTQDRGRPRITLAVSHDANRSPRSQNYFSEIIRSLLRVGCEVRLIAHDIRFDYDLGLLMRLQAEFEGVSEVMYCRPQSVSDALRAYADSDAVISQRMHPLILAALVGTLPVAIPRTAKVMSIAQDMRLPTLPDCSSCDLYGELLLAILSEKAGLLRMLAIRIGEFHSDVVSCVSETIDRARSHPVPPVDSARGSWNAEPFA